MSSDNFSIKIVVRQVNKKDNSGVYSYDFSKLIATHTDRLFQITQEKYPDFSLKWTLDYEQDKKDHSIGLVETISKQQTLTL